MDTCNAYLQEVKVSTILEGVNNEIISQEYLVCPSIIALRSAGSTSTAARLPASYGTELCSRLDLTTFPSSLRPRLNGAKRVLSALEIPLKADTCSCSFDTRDWFFKVEVVAEADFEKDGKIDWLVWLFDEAKTGNYRGYSCLSFVTCRGRASLPPRFFLRSRECSSSVGALSDEKSRCHSVGLVVRDSAARSERRNPLRCARKRQFSSSFALASNLTRSTSVSISMVVMLYSFLRQVPPYQARL